MYLILVVLADGPLHGYGILLRIEQLSAESLRVPQGSLYPALRRLENNKLLKATEGLSELKRKARYYSLTARGRRALDAETTRWQEVSEGIGRILATEELP